MRASFDPDRMDGLLLLAQTTTSTGYDGRGDFSMTPDGMIERRIEHGVVPFVFSGLSIAHPRLFDGAPEGAFSLNEVWNRAIDAERLYGVRLQGRWMHVGSPLGLSEAETLLTSLDA